MCPCKLIDCRYSVAAVALDQMSYQACLRHKATVMEVAATAARDGQSAMLGVYYDFEARSVAHGPVLLGWHVRV